jgi:predicted ABC-type ATPase
MGKKRLRIFAGPNGSGKSTIFNIVSKVVHCPHYINADLIEKELRSKGKLSFNGFSILVTEEELKNAFKASGLFGKTSHGQLLYDSLVVSKNVLTIPEKSLIDSYFTAFIAEFLRLKMLNLVEVFTIETVMSDPNKLDYIRLAKSLGYRVYLYYISTKDVKINIGRVRFRFNTGGHDVPEDKICKRYSGSLENLLDAVSLSDRAYFSTTALQVITLKLSLQNTTVPQNKFIFMPTVFPAGPMILC